MAQGAVVCFLCLFGFLQKGLPALIETQQIVTAAVGDRACLNCQLKISKDVLQVTWQRILPDGEQNLGTYNKYFGKRVIADFQGKVEFKDAGLQNCSIVIRRLTDQDEGCYRCLFNTYPEGAFTGRTCLKLYEPELHEPVLHVTEAPAEVVVSCSATGRPAPTVTLTVPHYNSSSVTNTNGSVTVTATAVVPRLHDNSTLVGCAVEVLSVPKKEVSTVIPQVKLSSDDAMSWTAGNTCWDFSPKADFTLILVLSVIVAGVCVAAAVIIFLIRRKHKKRDMEEIKTPQKPVKDLHVANTPLMTQENEARQRSSVKIKKYLNPNASSPSQRCQRQLF